MINTFVSRTLKYRNVVRALHFSDTCEFIAEFIFLGEATLFHRDELRREGDGKTQGTVNGR